MYRSHEDIGLVCRRPYGQRTVCTLLCTKITIYFFRTFHDNYYEERDNIRRKKGS